VDGMNEPTRTFKKLQLSGWRQFASVDIDFHPRLTVLTGVNGVGKSTLLNILARHVGVERPYLSVPRRNKEGGFTYWIGRLTSSEWLSGAFALSGWSQKPKNQVGEVTYSDGASAQLVVPDNVGSSYQLNFVNQQPMIGIAISSHRPLPAYRQIPNIPFTGIDPDQAYANFQNESNTHYLGQRSDQSLIFHIKSAIAAWAVMGEGNSILQPNQKQLDAYIGFTDILRKILPESLGFLELSVRPPDVVMVTKSGDFLIDAASGGVAALIEFAALIYGCSIRPDVKGRPFVVTIDEPENHLHPSLQRSLFMKLVDAFPLTQFITATHSPFIVSSLKDSNVYVLRYNTLDTVTEKTEASRVASVRLDFANRAGTASEILRDILGVPSTLPQWVETDLNRIVAKYQTRTFDETMLQQLRKELHDTGLEELFSEALAGLARSLQQR
jgi:energy-coupling factor transporter ATP-binding protein EcfA2